MSDAQISYLITGANRGIGFALVEAVSADKNNFVFATARSISQSKDLVKLSEERSNIQILELEAGNHKTYSTFADDLKKAGKVIDVLFGNHGISKDFAPPSATTRESILEHLEVNAISYLEIWQIVYPYMTDSKVKKIAFVSSTAGSVGGHTHEMFALAYGISKAALNYIMKSITAETNPQGFAVMAVHPGFVLSDMGNAALEMAKNVVGEANVDAYVQVLGPVTPAECATSLLRLLDELSTEKYQGAFVKADGTEIPF